MSITSAIYAVDGTYVYSAFQVDKHRKAFVANLQNYLPTNIPAIVYQYSSVLQLLYMLESPLYPLTFTVCRFASTCVPNFDWEDPSFTSVMNLYLGKVTRLFRKLALEPQFHQSTWQRFCNIFIGVNFALERNPSLALSWRDLIAVSSWDSVNGMHTALVFAQAVQRLSTAPVSKQERHCLVG